MRKCIGCNRVEKVLVVEDDRAITEIERDFLEINGLETFIVGDGIEDLNHACFGVSDLIFYKRKEKL